MEILFSMALAVVGIAMLCFGGNWLVGGGVAIARRLRVSSMVIGMTVVAYGTSTPELAASIAAVGTHGGIVLGNVIGSNIANVGMVIGVAAVLVPLAVSRRTLRREIPIMVGFTFLLIGLSADGSVSQYDGLVLLAALAGFTLYAYRQARRGADTDDAPQATMPRARSFIMLGIGVALLYFGAELTVDNAVTIATYFDIPERIIGITVIAIGTSLPELITSIMAIRKKQYDIGIGNIIGSNIYNILMIMGVASVIAGVPVAGDAFYDYAVMTGFGLAMFLGLVSGVIGRKMGIGLVAAYLAYLLYGLAQT